MPEQRKTQKINKKGYEIMSERERIKEKRLRNLKRAALAGIMVLLLVRHSVKKRKKRARMAVERYTGSVDLM